MEMPRDDEYRPSILNNIEVWDTNKTYHSGDEVLHNCLIMISTIDNNKYIPVWPGNPFWKLKTSGSNGGK